VKNRSIDQEEGERRKKEDEGELKEDEEGGNRSCSLFHG